MLKHPQLSMAFNIGGTNEERTEAFVLYQTALGAEMIAESMPPGGGDLPTSACGIGALVTDKYGVCWWLRT